MRQKNRAIFLERFFGRGISGEALLVYNFVPINWLWSGFINPRIRLPESGRQSLPHPYSPLRAPAFFRISRNRVQASNPHLKKSFWMKLILAHSGGKLLPKRVLFSETKEHHQISNASFWKRGRKNVFLQMF